VKNRITLVLGAFLIAVMVLLLAGCGEPDQVVIATGDDYHPFNFIDGDGRIDGLDPDLWGVLSRRTGLDCRWVLNDWETKITDLLDEQFDAIIAGMSVTDERERLIEKGILRVAELRERRL